MRSATYRVITFHTKTLGKRYVALAWNYEEAVLLASGDHSSYSDARMALEGMAQMSGVQLRWFDGEYTCVDGMLVQVDTAPHSVPGGLTKSDILRKP